MSESKSIKVLQVQNFPCHKDTAKSLVNATKMLEKYSAEDKIDLVIFPELCFSGYFFYDSEDISPYLEYKDEGQTFDFCSSQAKRLGSYVICSYPEKDRVKEGVNYLAQMVVGPDGSLVTSYAKHYLWCGPDANWATPGKGFEAFDLVNRGGQTLKVGLGICNDFWAYGYNESLQCQLAKYWRDQTCDVIAFSTAYPKFSLTYDHDTEESLAQKITNDVTRDYLSPMRPLWLGENGVKPKPCIAIMTNRIGTEHFPNNKNIHLKHVGDDKPPAPLGENQVFAGVSAMLRLSPSTEILATHPWNKESLICMDIQI